MPTVPHELTLPTIQRAFRDVWAALPGSATTQTMDSQRRRFMNAHDAVEDRDLVTLRQVRTLVEGRAAAFDQSLLIGPPGQMGPPGVTGPVGPTGPAGPGVATGGTAGQVLIKDSATDYDTSWQDAATPLAHHATHEPGGSDALVNVAWTNLANTFVPDQRLDGRLLFGADTILQRGGAQILELKNAATINQFKIYGSSTGYLHLWCDSGNARVTAPAGTALILGAHGVDRWTILTAGWGNGGLMPSADNSSDIGALASNRIRTLYAGTSVTVGLGNAAVSGAIRLANNASIVWRNAANNGDIQAFLLDNGNNLGIGVGTSVTSLNASADVRFQIGGTPRWMVTSTGIIPWVNNGYDIGSSGARVRNIYVAGFVEATGGLSTTPLNASNLTSGTVPDARLSANVQMKPIGKTDLPATVAYEDEHFVPSASSTYDIGNPTFLVRGIYTGTCHAVNNTYPAFVLTNPAQAANQKTWHLATFGTDFRIATVDDAQVGTPVVIVDRAGNVTVQGYIDVVGGINASQLLSGTVADARLTVNVLKVTGGYPGGTTNFLRADGIFAAPPAGGLTLPLAQDLTFSIGGAVRPTTADGSDNLYTILSGGGAPSGARGGTVWAFGNEESTWTGSVLVGLSTAASSKFYVRSSDYVTNLFSVDGSGSTVHGSLTVIGAAYLAANIQFTSNASILRNTDAGYLALCGGSNPVTSYGAIIALGGVSNASGLVDGGSMAFYLGNAGSATWKFVHSNGTLIWRIDALGEIQQHAYVGRHAVWNQAGGADGYMDFQRSGISYGYLGSAGVLGGGGESTTDDMAIRATRRLVLHSDTNQVMSMPIYNNNQTTTAANVAVASNGYLSRFTSSRRHKATIVTYDSDAALLLRPVTFTSLLPLDEGRQGLGFIAEEVAEIDPRFASYDHSGQPDGLSQSAIMAAMLATIKALEARISQLESTHTYE